MSYLPLSGPRSGPKSAADVHAVFIECRSRLHRCAMKILGSPDMADEVVQEAYLRVVHAREGEKADQPVAYLFQAVRNLAVDYHRRGSLEAKVFTAEEDAVQVAAENGTPEGILMARQHLRLVAELLASLPARTRQAFELHRLGGHTQREVAQMLGVSTTLVNFMIRDACELLMPWRAQLLAR
jgi:RNA polymerase sigma factor (sigma-70 family)